MLLCVDSDDEAEDLQKAASSRRRNSQKRPSLASRDSIKRIEMESIPTAMPGETGESTTRGEGCVFKIHFVQIIMVVC